MFAALALTIPLAIAPKPHIVWKPIPFGPQRKAEMAAYAKKHYGIHSWRLHPKVIVEHYTAQRQLLRGVEHVRGEHARSRARRAARHCAHFIVDRNGRSTSSSALNVMCRHTVGLNYAAIGIEHVGHVRQGDPPRQGAAPRVARLTAWLVDRFHIRIRNVIGHNESLSSPYHRELYKPWAHQTHADWKHADMRIYRAKLRALLRADAGR